MATSYIREQIVEIGIDLERLGILDLTAGNVSARVGEDAIAITPSGIPTVTRRPPTSSSAASRTAMSSR
jgi:ribulose-5-phosphate 4-epimerase/fuculose-1-phosphate aldolase